MTQRDWEMQPHVLGVFLNGQEIADRNEQGQVIEDDSFLLMFNAHLSSSLAPPVCFPSDENTLADKYAKLLFRMSSILPPKLMSAARDDGYPINGPARGFVFNADLVAVIRFLDIGTRVAAPR